MMSSPQYPANRTIISINQDENLQKRKTQSFDYDRNRFQRQVFNNETSPFEHAATSIYRNISGGSNKSKILIPYDDEDHATSLVSQLPSLDSDGKKFQTSRKHILKIEISPRNSLIKSHKINCGGKRESEKEVEKISSGDFDEVDRKMSVVSRISCNKNNNKSVTIIKHEEDDCDDNHYEDGNLSDDQKLVVLNGVVQKVTCNKSSNKNEMIGNVGRIILSGHCSPCGGSGDSGTCSDVEVNGRTSESPPPLPPKSYKIKMEMLKLSESTCSDASSASSSTTDSMQYHQLMSPELIRTINNASKDFIESSSSSPPPTTRVSFMLPTSLLDDIRNHSNSSTMKFSHNYEGDGEEEEDLRSENELMDDDDDELNYSDIVICRNSNNSNRNVSSLKDNRNSDNEFYDDDKFYKFHINENFSSMNLENVPNSTHEESDESFAGIKDLRSGTSTIRSSKGTIRGVKNRVRNGIATFQQMQQTTVKNYKEKDGGKIVLYTTSMGIVRSTYAKCQAMKQILRTLMVKFEERDVFMSFAHQQDIRDRMQSDDIEVPQLFVDGQYIGNADQVERLNETGELRTMLRPYKCRDSLVTCKLCGGYKMLPCPSCGGSKKSIHRNHFTAEFIALKCMNCDEVGLVKCYNC